MPTEVKYSGRLRGRLAGGSRGWRPGVLFARRMIQLLRILALGRRRTVSITSACGW